MKFILLMSPFAVFDDEIRIENKIFGASMKIITVSSLSNAETKKVFDSTN